jgi:hypothetical protein
MIDPKTFYTEKITSFSAQVSRLQNQLIRSSMLRLGVFIALVFGVFFFFENTKAIGVVLLFGIALFLFLITRHQDIKYKRDLLLQLIAINKKGEYAGYSLRKGFNYAICDSSNQNLLLDAEYAI